MLGVQNLSMIDSHESKLDVVLKAIEAFTARIGVLENLASWIGINQGAKLPKPMQHVVVEGPTLLQFQGNICSNQNLPEKFDGIQLKFWQFVNHVQPITILQSKFYPIDQWQVRLIGTLLMRQAFFWFAHLFERGALVLNNFKAFLATFAEAFEDHDKACSTTTKICILWQESRPASVYVYVLAYDINWDKEALMNQFHWGLWDNMRI